MRRQREDDAAKMQQVIKTLRSIVSIGDPDQKYENYKKIGQGASGTVYTAEEVATGRQVRVRTSHKPCFQVQNFQNRRFSKNQNVKFKFQVG